MQTISEGEAAKQQRIDATKEAEASHDYESVLDLIGFGKIQWAVLFTAGLLLMMVINETVGINMITLAAQCDFQMDSMDKALLSAASFLGVVISSCFWGFYSDTYGRRPVLISSTLLGNAVSLVSMWVPNFWVFVALRVLVGVFIAGASSTVYAYLGEFYTVRFRAVVINYASMFVGVSMIYVPAVAWFILPIDWSLHITDTFVFRPWRLLIFFNLLPGFIGAMLLLLVLPESPKLLLAQQKPEVALAVLESICQRNKGISLAHYSVYKLKCEPAAHSESYIVSSSALARMWQETRPLFKQPHVWNFLISCVIMCGLFLSSTGMGLWFPEIQNRVGSSTDYMSVCQFYCIRTAFLGTQLCSDEVSDKSLIDSIVVGCSYVCGFIILGGLVKFLSRKAVMCIVLSVTFLCVLALQWLLHPFAIVFSFCMLIMLPGLMVSVLSGAVVDLVPTYLRGKAVCICLMMGRSGGIIGSNMVGSLLETNCALTFYLFAGIVLLCSCLTLFLPI